MFQRLGFADMQVIPSEMALGVSLVEWKSRIPCPCFALSGRKFEDGFSCDIMGVMVLVV